MPMFSTLIRIPTQGWGFGYRVLMRQRKKTYGWCSRQASGYLNCIGWHS